MSDTYTVESGGPLSGGIAGGAAGGGPSINTGGDFWGMNPAFLGGLGAAGILGASALGGNSGVPYAPQMEGVIGNLGGVAQTGQAGYNDLMARGSTFLDPILSGKLPGGQEQVIQNMIKGQETATKGRYASLGLSGSTMEGDALTNVQNQAMTQRYQLEQQLAQIGQQAVSQAIQELGISERAFGDQAQAYGAMMKAQMQQDQNTSNTIANFAKALGTAAAMF